MKNESFIVRNPRQEAIEKELDVLKEQERIGKELIQTGLLGEDDEFPEHLVTHVHEIVRLLNRPNIEIARKIAILGYGIDTHLANGGGLGEMLMSTHEDLGELIHELLADEFPDVGEDAVNLVIGRTIDTKSVAEYYVDTLLRAIAERKQIMRSNVSSTYITDTSNNITERLSK